MNFTTKYSMIEVRKQLYVTILHKSMEYMRFTEGISVLYYNILYTVKNSIYLRIIS